MDIPSLTAFIAVAECGSFSTAAARLHLTQPAISKRIASLESQLDTLLFDRSNRQVNLNEAGRALLPKARQMLELMKDTRQQITNLKGQIKGPLSMATSHHIGLRRLPDLLKKFARTHPEVTLDIRFVDSEAAYTMLQRGEIELGVITLAPQNPQNYISRIIWDDPMVFMASQEHHLASLKKVSAAQLSQHQAVLPGSSTFTYRMVRELFEQEGLELQTALSSNYLETIRMLAAIGLAWCILPSSMLGDDLVPLNTDIAAPSRQLGYILHKDRTLSNAARAFIEMLEELSDS